MDEAPLYPFFGPGRLLAFAYDYSAGSLQQRHRHDVPQLLHAIRGVMRVTTPDGYWVIPPERAVWIPAYVEHEVRMDGPVFMRTLYVGGDVTPFAPARCTVVDVPSLLRELIVSLVSEADPPDPGLCARRHALETLALVELASLTALPFHVPLPKDPRLSRLCRWLLDHPDDGRTFDELARQAGASARTLRRIFREEIGMGFATWRQQARLIDGMARLAEGRSVSQVAEELGYATPSAFTAMFKRMMGLPPTSIADDRTHDRRQTQDQDPAVARAPHDGRRITPDRPRTGRTPNRRRASAGYGRS